MANKKYTGVSQYKNQLVLRAFHNRFNDIRSRRLSPNKRKEVFNSNKVSHQLNKKTKYEFNYIAC